jgi:hypothetical protein
VSYVCIVRFWGSFKTATWLYEPRNLVAQFDQIPNMVKRLEVRDYLMNQTVLKTTLCGSTCWAWLAWFIIRSDSSDDPLAALRVRQPLYLLDYEVGVNLSPSFSYLNWTEKQGSSAVGMVGIGSCKLTWPGTTAGVGEQSKLEGAQYGKPNLKWGSLELTASADS